MLLLLAPLVLALVGGAPAGAASAGTKGTALARAVGAAPAETTLRPIARSGLTVADPEGGAPWRSRVYRSTGGRLCQRYGPVGGAASLSCARPRRGAVPLSVGVTNRAAVGGRPARTIVRGLVAGGVRSVEVVGPNARRLPLSPRGRGFLGVFPGVLRAQELPLRFRMRRGPPRTLDWGAGAQTAAVDPETGQTWRVTGDERPRTQGARRGQSCVQLEPADLSATGPDLLGAVICGVPAADGVVFEALAYRGRLDIPGVAPVTARTVVFGLAGPDVRSVAIEGLGDGRPLPLARRGRAFLAVFPPQFAPESLVLAVTFEDGTVVRHTGSHGVRRLPSEAPPPPKRRG